MIFIFVFLLSWDSFDSVDLIHKRLTTVFRFIFKQTKRITPQNVSLAW